MIWIILILLRIYIDPSLDVWYIENFTIVSIILYKLGIIMGLISLFQISSLFYQNNYLIYLSGLTFFVYLYHHVPLSYFTIIVSRFIDKEYLFYITFPTATVVIFLSAHLLAKHLSFLYMLLTGGRSPNKALQRVIKNK